MQISSGEGAKLVSVQIIEAPTLETADKIYQNVLDHRLTVLGANHEVIGLVGTWANNPARVATIVSEALKGPVPEASLTQAMRFRNSFLKGGKRTRPSWLDELGLGVEIARLNSPDLWLKFMLDSIAQVPDRVRMMSKLAAAGRLQGFAGEVSSQNAIFFGLTNQLLGLAAVYGNELPARLKDIDYPRQDPWGKGITGFAVMTGEGFGQPAMDFDGLVNRLQKVFTVDAPNLTSRLKDHGSFRQYTDPRHEDSFYLLVGGRPRVRSMIMKTADPLQLRLSLGENADLKRIQPPRREGGVHGCPALDLTQAIYTSYGNHLRSPDYRATLRRRVNLADY